MGATSRQESKRGRAILGDEVGWRVSKRTRGTWKRKNLGDHKGTAGEAGQGGDREMRTAQHIIY